MIRSPVVLFAFNRPELTRRSFQRIRECQPSSLYLVMDGPRASVPSDLAACADVRSVLDQVDWPCHVHRNYSEQNLGLKRRVSSGLDWVFSASETAIVIEDDCVPHPDFFTYCDGLLDLYKNDDRVYAITGDNFQDGIPRGDASYYFSKYSHCWGWASWRRAWTHYDGELRFWSAFVESDRWPELMPDPVERAYWLEIFAKVREGRVQSWAYPWMASIWSQGGLTATPNANLVENIGFDPTGTNALRSDDDLAGLPVASLGPIRHPGQVIQNAVADQYVFNHAFGGRNRRWPRSLVGLPRRLLRALRRLVPTKHRHGSP